MNANEYSAYLVPGQTVGHGGFYNKDPLPHEEPEERAPTKRRNREQEQSFVFAAVLAALAIGFIILITFREMPGL
jgi:hypothetical protein